MNIHTAYEFDKVITRELSWRKKELITLKLQHEVSREHQQLILRRCGIVLLYAHWEGFVKCAGTQYLELVGRQGRKYRDLTDNFVAIGTRQKLSQASGKSGHSAACEAVEFFRSGMEQKANIPWDKIVQTKSNLSAERTKEIITVLGLDYTPFAIHEKPVIEKLLYLRNNVAHGQHLDVTLQDFRDLHAKTIDLIEELDSQLKAAADNKAYLRPGTL